MRPQVVVAVLLVATVAMVSAYLLKKAPPQAPVETAATGVSVPESELPKPVQPANPPTPIPTVAATPAASTNQVVTDPAVISATIKRLQTLQWNDDPVSLQGILTELTNASPVIRHAAIESTIQFRDRAAIPVLRDLAARTEDPVEKKELIDAADFMALPTIREIRAKKAAENPNAGQASPPPPRERLHPKNSVNP